MESSREIQKYAVAVELLVRITRQVVHKRKQLRITGEEFAKTVLCIVKERVGLEKTNEM